MQTYDFSGGSLLVVSLAESYRDLPPSMQRLVQQGLSILLNIAECLGLRFKLLPEGCACLLFLLQSLVQRILQACICSATWKTPGL